MIMNNYYNKSNEINYLFDLVLVHPKIGQEVVKDPVLPVLLSSTRLISF